MKLLGDVLPSVMRSDQRMAADLVGFSGMKCPSQRLEKIQEDSPAGWLPVSPSACALAPETPIESMEFLARSWSLSAAELAKALCADHTPSGQKPAPSADHHGAYVPVPTAPPEPLIQLLSGEDAVQVSPRKSQDMKELFLLHQALNPEVLSAQQAFIYKSAAARGGKTIGRKVKDQKERKKQEMRTHNAQLHAAVSVAGVAAAVAALAASALAPAPDSSADVSNRRNYPCNKTSASLASAAALVASHCIDVAEEMGADHDRIRTVVRSAVGARTNGDIMTLTAAAATALRGAAMLKARMQNGCGPFRAASLMDERIEEGKDRITAALNFVGQGDELLKRTRKGDLHWKQVSFSINSHWQVVIKMKSKHMAGAFTKKKKCVVCGVCCDVPGWAGRECRDGVAKRAYFGVKTAERVIEFECRDEVTKQMWTEGLQHLLHLRYL